ncbi:MAG: enoyl-CoA hydratase/isomerase family protein [Kofleriaceae bacterium]|nr:enoyl-CoA hydratase/isomerase family protein [Kofleriaceae bacterium]
MTNSPPVLVEYKQGIALITLNRPDNRNSMTPEILQGFSDALDEVQSERDTRVVVITGSGSCFSAGADFKSNLQTGGEELLDHQRSYAMYEPFLRVLDIEVPVIAALNGHAVGGGFGLSLVCDIRIANAQAKYGANFARLGLHPGMGISYVLPRLIGISRASELLYTGRLILGQEAQSIGLVSSAHAPEKVLESAMEMATTIAANAPVAIRLTKESIRQHLNWDVRNGAYMEAYAQAATLRMDDAKEGMAALLEKRPPEFSGK